MILVHRQLTGKMPEGGLIYEEIGEGCICCGMALEFEEKMRRIAMEDCPDRIFIEASGFGKLSDVVKVSARLKEKGKILEMMIWSRMLQL